MKLSQKNQIAVGFFILALSLALRIYQVGAASYWLDEMVSLHFAKNPYWSSVFLDNSPFLYPLLLKIWVRLFGDGEVATRSLSVLFSTSTTAVLMIFGALSFGFLPAAIFGFLHAIFPLSIEYAQETRAYAMFEFFAALNLVFFYRFLLLGKNLRSYLVSVLFLSLSHFLSVVVLVLQGLVLLFRFYQRRQFRQLKILGSVILIVCVVFCVSYFLSFSWHFLEWQKLKFQVEGEGRWPLPVLWDLLFGNWPALLALSALLVVGCARPPFIEFFLIAPLALLSVFAILSGRDIFLSRYFIYMVPLVVVACGLKLGDWLNGKKWKKRGAVVAIGAILGGTAYRLGDGFYLAHKAPWNEVAALVAGYPNSFVLTTRTLALRTPYFERISVPVEKMNLSDASLQQIVSAAHDGKNIWIVDNFWGGLTYFPDLKERLLREHDLEVNEFAFQKEKTERIVALLIRRKI